MLISNLPKIYKAPLIISIGFITASCASYQDRAAEAECIGNAYYEVVFTSTWSEETHPQDMPKNPMYSHLFGVSHNYDVDIWKPGHTASTGLKDIAERGIGYRFIKQAEWSIKKDDALNVFDGNDLMAPPYKSQVQFELTREFPLVSLVSMIAPSPDWIIGVSALNLCENGAWVESKTLDAEVYDAGTDSGKTYTAADQATEEREPIVLLEGSGRSDYASFPSVGKFVFTKIENISDPSGAGYVTRIRELLDRN